MDLADLIQDCVTYSAPDTISAVVRQESSGYVFAVNVNSDPPASFFANDIAEALAFVDNALLDGHSVDIGLMQINSLNLDRYGISLRDAFNPCLNLAIGDYILAHNYTRASKVFGEGQDALKAALSSYNTGNFVDGFANGYVSKYYPKNQKERDVMTREFKDDSETIDDVAYAWSKIDQPGSEAAVSPDLAEEMGAFTEDAISEEEARESSIDLED